MKYFSLFSLCAVLALIPGCCRNGSGYQRSCCPTTSCETPASTQVTEVIIEAPAMSTSQKDESIEIEEEIEDIPEAKTEKSAPAKEDRTSDKEDLDDNDDSQSAKA